MSQTVAISAALVTELPAPPRYRNITALNNAFGVQMLELQGAAETKALSGFAQGDTVLFVESTYRFPDSGQFWMDGILFDYASKTDGAFHGVEHAISLINAIPASLVVTRADRVITLPA